MKLKELVRQAADKKGITGVMALTELVDLDYRKVVRVWNGEKNAKLADVEHIFKCLGYQLTTVKK